MRRVECSTCGFGLQVAGDGEEEALVDWETATAPNDTEQPDASQIPAPKSGAGTPIIKTVIHETIDMYKTLVEAIEKSSLHQWMKALIVNVASGVLHAEIGCTAPPGTANNAPPAWR